MGTYTCMRFVGKVKDKYQEDLKRTLSKEKFFELGWRAFGKKYEFARNFAELDRADFIPFGSFSAYNFNKFSDKKFDDDNTDPTFNTLSYGTWIFQCDLKNYDHEIQIFLEEVAKEICENFIAEVWHEEEDFPAIWLYNMKDNLVDLNENTD